MAILACALFAAVTFQLVERPVEVLRRKIKAREDPQATPATSEAAASAASPAIRRLEAEPALSATAP